MAESVVYIGLGSNLDRPLFQLKKALGCLAHQRGIRLQRYSSLYLTEPIGYEAQPVFMNAVARLSTGYSPHRLLDILQAIEHRQHRRRTSNRNSARTLDLDMLLYQNLQCHTGRLTLPHPRMHQRRFVLQPLLEISPSQRIPGKGPAAAFMPGVSTQGCRRNARILLI